MKGLELSRKYYEEYGIPIIKEQFSQYENRIAVGLVGNGSECFGFDDEISTDHDFGPSFCMYLTDEDYNDIGLLLMESYNSLPKEFMGYKRIVSPHGGGRVGVFRIGDFYKSFIGKGSTSLSLDEWLYIPEHFLAVATNGKVFRDDLGEFSKIREYLLDYYPEDVRIKKIAARAAVISQSGQYNYSRSMRRGEFVAARLALDEFIKNTILMVYLLNKKYTPFYKWMHRGMEKFKILPEIRGMIENLINLPVQKEVWQGQDASYWKYQLNMDDKAVVLIESMCKLIVNELKNQQLTNKDDAFLENHTSSIMSHINDNHIKMMHVMRG